MDRMSSLLQAAFQPPRKYILFGLAALTAFLIVDDLQSVFTAGTIVTPAQAVIGRPLTPGSVAGVARRTTRRAYRRGYYGYGHPYRY